MSVQYAGNCYADQATALSAFAAAQVGQWLNSSLPGYVIEATPNVGGAIVVKVKPFGGSPNVSTNYTPAFHTCTLDTIEQSYDALGIDPLTVAACFGWAFATVILFWYFGYCIGTAKSAVKKGLTDNYRPVAVAISTDLKGVVQMADIFAAVDLSTVAVFVAATGVVVIGITMAFKGIDLGKRGVKKA